MSHYSKKVVGRRERVLWREFCHRICKNLLKTREKDNTKELKAIREKVRFLSYIISLVQEDPDLSKNYVMALSEIKKYIDRIIYGEN